jgi:hypothetical protein
MESTVICTVGSQEDRSSTNNRGFTAHTSTSAIDFYSLDGRAHEGNTEEENNGYVVFKWNIFVSAGK